MNGILLWIVAALRWLLPIAKFVWQTMKLPHTVQEFMTNHFDHLKKDVGEIKESLADCVAEVRSVKADVRGVKAEQMVQRKVCEGTRGRGHCPPDPRASPQPSTRNPQPPTPDPHLFSADDGDGD